MDYYYFDFLPVTVGLGGLMTFLFSKRWQRLYDRIHLALTTCCLITVYIVVRALVFGAVDYAYVFLDNLESLTVLSIFPLFYLYFRTMTHDNRWHHWYWWLFAPSAVLTTSNIVLGYIVGWGRIISAQLNGFYPVKPTSMTLVEKLFMLSDVTLLNLTVEVMAVVLIVLCIQHLYKYHKNTVNYYANLEESCFDNMNRHLFSGILFMIVIFVVTCFMREINEAGNHVILIFAICLAVIFAIMLYNAFKIKVSEKYIGEISFLQHDEGNFTSAEKDADIILGEKIAAWERRKDKPFCKEGLTLVVLAKDLGVSRQTLSAYINTHKGVNFNLWINTLRLEESKRMLRMSRNLKIGYISDICGFGTQSAFSKIFHRLEGCTPQEYRDQA